MIKNMITDKKNICFDGGKLLDIKNEIENLISTFGENAELVIDSGYSSLDTYIEFLREETETEYRQRLKKEQKQKEIEEKAKKKEEEKSRKLYEQLKKKYG